MYIKILGTGCARCHDLEKTTRETIKELNIDATIEQVKDINEIMEFPILTTPGLVIDGKVVCSGKVPTKKEIIEYINVSLNG
jgi:small redox-active disulfide protein 2